MIYFYRFWENASSLVKNSPERFYLKSFEAVFSGFIQDTQNTKCLINTPAEGRTQAFGSGGQRSIH